MLRVAGARTRAAIKGLDPDDFPAIPPPGGAPAARVEAGRLRDLIGRVAFSAGTDDSRPTLKGVHLQLDGARLVDSPTDH
jgi:DNA polymerase III sliding clamp (beta) subunit (PCNA family)